MGRYISVFFLALGIIVILFFILANIFDGGSDVEIGVYIFGSIIVILLTFLVSQMYYLIDLIKNKSLGK